MGSSSFYHNIIIEKTTPLTPASSPTKIRKSICLRTQLNISRLLRCTQNKQDKEIPLEKIKSCDLLTVMVDGWYKGDDELEDSMIT